MKKMIYIGVIFCVVGMLFNFRADGLPAGWTAMGSKFGGEQAVAFQSDLTKVFAKSVPANSVAVSPEFTINKPWMNVRINGEKLAGRLDVILLCGDAGKKRVIRSAPSTALQVDGWLKDGWFSFDVDEYIGQSVYCQLRGVNRLSDINIDRIEISKEARGVCSEDWYVRAVDKLLWRDASVADSDPFRPVLHARAPSGKSWDANGLIYKDGLYHFFYLVRPNGAPPFQGHKVSEDLVRWEERPPAVVPSIYAGEEAVWSGSAVIDDDGRCHIFYTGVGPDRSSVFTPRQAHAVSDDPRFVRFEKADISMIKMEDIPVPMQNVRDPFVFRNGEQWYMTLTGSILKDGMSDVNDWVTRWPKNSAQGALILFVSDDLYDWNYVNIVARSDKKNLWEVSDLFQMDDRWFYSPGGRDYHVGKFDLDTGIFTETRSPGVACLGLFYAYRSMTAPDGRVLVMSRLKEGGDLRTRKWEGVYSFPREWCLKDEVLYQIPACELQQLRGKHFGYIGSVSNNTVRIDGAATEYELVIEMDRGSADTCGIIIRRSDTGAEGYRITWDGTAAYCKGIGEEVTTWWMNPIRIIPENKVNQDRVKFHVFVDRGLVEVFVDDQKTFERPVESIPLSCTNIAVFASGGTAEVVSYNRWNLKKN